MDGLAYYSYRHAQIRFKPEIMQSISDIECMGQSLLAILDAPAEQALALSFLTQIEEFLAKTLEFNGDFVPFLAKLSSAELMNAFRNFQCAPSRHSALQALMPLVGCRGQSVSLGQLRSITAMARFLNKQNWAALSWRIFASVGFHSITEFREFRQGTACTDMWHHYREVTEDEIVLVYQFLEALRKPELPTIPDTCMALYNLSLSVWPSYLSFEKDPNPS
jgi:hypothetical protein